MDSWAVVVASVVGAGAGLAGTYRAVGKSGGDHHREQAGAAAALLGSAQLLSLECSWFASERSMRHPLLPLRPGARDLKTVLLHRFDEIGTAHARLSLVASERVMDRGNAVMDVCGRLGRLVNLAPDDAAWEAALNDLARATVQFKNGLRAQAKLSLLIPPRTPAGSSS
jgi:hypothetical protein